MRKCRNHLLVGLLLSVVAVLASAVLLAGPAGAGSSPYTITDLGTISPYGDVHSVAYAINDAGQVVGESNSWYFPRHAFTWRNGVMTDLVGIYDSRSLWATDVNESGQVVIAEFAGPWVQVRGHIWDDGVMTDIGFLDPGYPGPWDVNQPHAINDSGTVVGMIASTVDLYYRRAYRWDDGVTADLGALSVFAGAAAINNSGQIVGFTGVGWPPVPHAFLWDDGVMSDLGFSGSAKDINDVGQVVGGSTLWDDGETTDLGAFSAEAINDLGQIVGTSGDHAALWDDGVIVDLGSLEGYPISVAYDINDSGWIVGYASTGHPDYETRAVLWTPVADTTPPEITAPTDLTVNASSPDGAVVEFTATATDDVDGNVPVDCTPASGSTFAIGDTTVVCTAEDNSGNEASVSFTIHVAGAMEQLANLFAAVEGIGTGTSLADMVSEVQAALSGGNDAEACEILNAFINHLEAQAGKHVDALVAEALIADATRIRAAIGCST